MQIKPEELLLAINYMKEEIKKDTKGGETIGIEKLNDIYIGFSNLLIKEYIGEDLILGLSFNSLEEDKFCDRVIETINLIFKLYCIKKYINFDSFVSDALLNKEINDISSEVNKITKNQ